MRREKSNRKLENRRLKYCQGKVSSKRKLGKVLDPSIQGVKKLKDRAKFRARKLCKVQEQKQLRRNEGIKFLTYSLIIIKV